MKQVSVVIPCYNAAPYIVAALQSVQNQTYPAHEIIVVDDGCSDDSVAQIRGTGIPVVLLQTARAGCSGARLAGVRRATGDWIAYLDADDVWYPSHLEAARDALATTGDVAYLGHLACLVHGTEKPFLPSTGPLLDDMTSGLTHEQFLKLFAQRWYFSPSSVLQCRERVLEVGGPDPDLPTRADVELFMRVIHGHTWTYNPEVHWCYRLGTPGNLSGNQLRGEEELLTALLKNEKLYAGDTMSYVIRHVARRVMGLAFTAGTIAEQQRAMRTAWPKIPRAFQLFYRAMNVWQAPFRGAIKLKRLVQQFVWRMRRRYAAPKQKRP